MKRIFLTFLLVPALLFFPSCSTSVIEDEGFVYHYNIEGGFYGITTNGNEKYEPVNLATEFQKDVQPVKFKAKVIKDQVNTHMWGTLVEILEMQSNGDAP